MSSPGKAGKSYAARRAHYARDLWMGKLRSQGEDTVITAFVTLVAGGLSGWAKGVIEGGFWGGVVGSIAGGIGGPILAAVMLFLWRWLAAPSLMWSRQEAEIASLTEKLTGVRDFGAEQMRDRVALYRQAHECVNRFLELSNASQFGTEEEMTAAEGRFRNQLEILNSVVLRADIRESAKYGGAVAMIRTALDQRGHVFNKSTALLPLVDELWKIQRVDHAWDLERAGLLVRNEEPGEIIGFTRPSPPS